MNTQKEKTSRETDLNTQIVPQANEVVKFDPEQDIKQGQKAAKALMQVIEITKPLKLGGKTYLYFEHWQTIAKFFRMTVGTEWVKPTENGYEAKAVVYQNGQIVGGAEASCNKDEANWKSKPDFQLKSMAQTRAMGKALRSILGYIPVLAGIEATPAEEMNHDTPTNQESAISGGNTSKSEIRATPKQINYIKALIKQKGQTGKATDEQINNLSLPTAKEWIDRLLKMEDKTEEDVIQLEEPYSGKEND